MTPQPPPPPFDPMDVLNSPDQPKKDPPPEEFVKAWAVPIHRHCKHCGGQVRPDVTKCRHCGEFLDGETDPGDSRVASAASRGPSTMGWVVIIGVFGFISLLIAGNVQHARNEAEAAKYVPDAQMQQDRLKFIAGLEVKGVFTKVDQPGDVPHIWVGTKFYLLSFDQKAAACNVVFAYYFPNPNDPRTGNLVTLYDSRTGKSVGRYSRRGLEIY